MMLNDLKYTVRSREIVDLVSAMRSSRLTLSPYFQRNLVWRDSHRRDFIDTILKGYPFPQIFLSRGPINIETMEAMQAVVDGQQRLNTIRDYVNGRLDVNGKFFRDLPIKSQEDFLKYEVAVIDFDLDAGDPRLKDIFYRLNRTYYSLSSIEKLASEYSASEFMLVARVLSGEITPLDKVIDIEEFDAGEDDVLLSNPFSRDPGIDEITWEWYISHSGGPYVDIISTQPIFSKFEFDRKVPLMFTLNVMCTVLNGYYPRNDRVREFLDEWASAFPGKEKLMFRINDAANFISSLHLDKDSVWWNKANFFSLIVEIGRWSKLPKIKQSFAAKRLNEFSRNINNNKEYLYAAREGVNSKTNRETRGRYVRLILDETSKTIPLGPED